MTRPKPIYSESGHFCIALSLSRVQAIWKDGLAPRLCCRRSFKEELEAGGTASEEVLVSRWTRGTGMGFCWAERRWMWSPSNPYKFSRVRLGLWNLEHKTLVVRSPFLFIYKRLDPTSRNNSKSWALPSVSCYPTLFKWCTSWKRDSVFWIARDGETESYNLRKVITRYGQKCPYCVSMWM